MARIILFFKHDRFTRKTREHGRGSSTRLVTERLWVRIPLGVVLFPLLFPDEIDSLKYMWLTFWSIIVVLFVFWWFALCSFLSFQLVWWLMFLLIGGQVYDGLLCCCFLPSTKELIIRYNNGLNRSVFLCHRNGMFSWFFESTMVIFILF